MSIHEITNKVNELSATWEQFKVLNDRRLGEIEKKGSADPLTLTHLEKLNNNIEIYQDNINKIEASFNRPNSELKNGFFSTSVREHKEAFSNYLRKGTDINLAELEKKALSSSSDSDGGFLISRPTTDMIVRGIQEYSPMRQHASVTTISGDALELIADNENAVAIWAQETEARNITSSPTINKIIIPVHELYAQPKATQKLLDDTHINVDEWLVNKLVESFTRTENAAFINGDGIGKPRGILSYSNGESTDKIKAIFVQNEDNITTDSIINLAYSLKENYSVRAKFLMNRATIQAIRMLKDTRSGRYLWQPSFKDGAPETILGAEVIHSADMPAIAKDELIAVYADFKAAYQIVDRQNIKILRDPFTDKPFVKFYTTKRVGGDVINFDAIKILKLSV